MRRRLWDVFDPGIAPYVGWLFLSGIETNQSCEGGKGYPYPEPTIEFDGNRFEGFRALCVALERGMPVKELRRFWSIEEGEPCGPYWALTFWEKAPISSSD